MSADIWAFGVTFYAILTGEFPFANAKEVERVINGKDQKLIKSIYGNDALSQASVQLLKGIFCVAADRYNSFQLLEHPYFTLDTLVYDIVNLIEKHDMPKTDFSSIGKITDIFAHYASIADKKDQLAYKE